MKTHIRDKSDDVRNRLYRLVDQSDLQIGDQLPSEISLASDFGYSRNTVRETLAQLEAEGVVLRKHGIGTFLREFPKHHGNYLSFPNMINELGMTPQIRLVRSKANQVSGAVARELNARRPNEITCVERIIFGDDRPLIVVRDYVPKRLAGRITDPSCLTGDMVALMGKLMGQRRFSQKVSVSAIGCDTECAAFLQIAAGAPLVHVHSVLQTMALEPVIASDCYIRPNTIPLNYLGTIRVDVDD